MIAVTKHQEKETKTGHQGLVRNIISGLATGSVLQSAKIQDSQMPSALFTITFLVGAIMFVLDVTGVDSVFPTMTRILAAEKTAWDAA